MLHINPFFILFVGWERISFIGLLNERSKINCEMLLISNHSMFRRKCRHDCVKMISVCVIIGFYNKTAKSELGGGNGMNERGLKQF